MISSANSCSESHLSSDQVAQGFSSWVLKAYRGRSCPQFWAAYHSPWLSPYGDFLCPMSHYIKSECPLSIYDPYFSSLFHMKRLLLLSQKSTLSSWKTPYIAPGFLFSDFQVSSCSVTFLQEVWHQCTNRKNGFLTPSAWNWNICFS